MPAPGSLGWARGLAVRRFTVPLLATLAMLNLLWPTSAPLQANGAPLNAWVEFALAAIFVGWLGLLLSFAVLRRIDPEAAPAQRFSGVDRSLTALALILGALLLLIRALAPPDEGFTACYSTPELPDVPCLFLADGWAPAAISGTTQGSRVENQLLFDPERGYPWRLGAFNDLAFNIYGSKPSERLNTRREQFRRDRAHPFDVAFTWDAATGDRLATLFPSGAQLRINYRGEAALVIGEKTRILPFARREREKLFNVTPNELRSLRLDYANYTCPDDACRHELTMKPLAFSQAAFGVYLSPPGTPTDQAVLLDQRLLAQATTPLSPLRWAGPVESAFVLILLVHLVIWMIRMSLARRPSSLLVIAAVLVACVLAPRQPWDHLLIPVRTPVGFVTLLLIVVPAFLFTTGLLFVLFRRRERGHPPDDSVQGKLLRAIAGVMAPGAAFGFVVACLGAGYLVFGPILGLVADADRSWEKFPDPAFVLMALPVILAVGGVLVVVALRRPVTTRTIAPALLVLASAGLLMQLPATVATMASMTAAPMTGMLSAEGQATDLAALPPRDDIALYFAGDDPLTYASWAKDVLHSPRRFVEPTVVWSKPFFVYLRAARYALFGDGEVYALAWSRAFICWVVAIGGVLALSAVGAPRGSCPEPGARLHAGTGLIAILSALVWICLSYSVLTLDESTLVDLSRLSEGPAATAVLMSFGLVIAANWSTRVVYVAAGAMFGLSLLYRTSNLPLALLGLAIVSLAPTPSFSSWLRNSAAYLAPIAVALLTIWLHAGAPLSAPPEIAAYVAQNAGTPQAPPGSHLYGLVPNALTLQIVCSALIAVVVALIMPAAASARVRAGALGLAVIFGALLPLMPQRGAPYYPRNLITVYYAIAFVPLALMISLWRSWLPIVDRPEMPEDDTFAG